MSTIQYFYVYALDHVRMINLGMAVLNSRTKNVTKYLVSHQNKKYIVALFV